MDSTGRVEESCRWNTRSALIACLDLKHSPQLNTSKTLNTRVCTTTTRISLYFITSHKYSQKRHCGDWGRRAIETKTTQHSRRSKDSSASLFRPDLNFMDHHLFTKIKLPLRARKKKSKQICCWTNAKIGGKLWRQNGRQNSNAYNFEGTKITTRGRQEGAGRQTDIQTHRDFLLKE